ncbi:cytokinin dehydrogenase 3-like [Typha latifolia]|uniref:cytokinin dehydrogenase 3-like n=1 Tax=Typha latifolia TaxID=4733 RepID=UPI003C2ADBEF
MDFALLCARVYTLFLLVLLYSPCMHVRSPIDLNPLNSILQTPTEASVDYGRIIFNSPAAILRPKSPKDISLLLGFLSSSSSNKYLTVAARGAGHSIYGQAQASGGIVIEMDSLPSSIKIHRSGDGDKIISYADVSGGALWIELLEESLKLGLAPRSWTDYLYLSIGGTLSNAGISGQAFKYGPQISNVLQLDIITGEGELVTCSPSKSSELFYAALGGLGQFGIITSARIILQEAPKKVRWVRAFYSDFDLFTKDQEMLISMPEKVDYVEGFIVLNEKNFHNSFAAFPSLDSMIPKLEKGILSEVYYCIEFTVYDYQLKDSNVKQVAEDISREMSYMPSLIYTVEVSYYDFLNRVSIEEKSLRERGMWDVSHPWLNILVPKSGIEEFKDLLLEIISPDQEFEGLILIYPLLRDKWATNTSAVLPESDEVVYIVGILRSANPSDRLSDILRENCRMAKAAAGNQAIRAKQYLPHYHGQEQWKEHFGSGWEQFAGRKIRFDPRNVLGPGQGIFPN